MKKILLSVLALALLAGCASSSSTAFVHPGPFPEMAPEEGLALVTFYRPNDFGGSLISFYVQENGRNVGVLKNGTYFSARTTPGRHTYTAGEDAITITAKPNETNYVEATTPAGAWLGVLHLKEVPADMAKSEIPQLKYIEWQPAGAGKGGKTGYSF
jgi:hypothetical protein